MSLPVTYSEIIVTVEPKFLHPNPHNPRTSGPGDVTELKNSIEEQGVLEPLLVRAYPAKGKGHYIIDAGERRWTAGKFIPIDLPCRVGVLSDGVDPVEHTLLTGLTENGTRTNLNAIERAKAYQRLMNEFGLTQTALAARLGVTGGTISRTMNLLVLSPRTQQAVIDKNLTIADAQRLVTQHRERGRKKAGQASRIPDFQPATFTENHFLASKARRLCNESDHDGRVPIKVGNIACDAHWERAIRLDEAKVQRDAAREQGFDVPFMSPEMAAAGNALGNGEARERR